MLRPSSLALAKKKRASIHITALLDLFAILAVFLLFGFQESDEGFVLHAGLQLPQSSARNTFKSGINIAITQGAIFVEGKKVYALRSGSLPAPKDIESGKISRVVSAVKHASKQMKDTTRQETVLIQASKTIPYQTLHLAMQSAMAAGEFQFRLAVERK